MCCGLVVAMWGCDSDSTVSTYEDMGITTVDLGASMDSDRLYPVSDFSDPVDRLHDVTNLHLCQVWVDRFQPRDRVASERLILTYDAASQWVLEEVDVGLDRAIDRRRSRIFDAMEQLSILETDNQADGLPDQRITYEWEANRLVREDHDQNADGMVEGRRRYRYSTNGWLVADEWVGLPQGEILQRTTYEYDAAGRQTVAQHTVGIEERLAWQIVSAYDEYGRLSDWQEDNDGDGAFDYRILYTINDDERQITERHDQGNDGAIDGITITNYDDRNRPILREVDQAGDGTVNERVRFEYDGLRLLRRSIDRDLDGREDEITEYEYDDFGRVVAKSSDVSTRDDLPPESWTVRYFCP